MEELPEAVIHGAEDVLLRDDRVLQHQLAGIRRAPAELVFFLRRHHAATLGERRIVAHADPLGLLEIGRVLGHDECGDAPGLLAAGSVRAVTTKISPTPAWVMKIFEPFRT